MDINCRVRRGYFTGLSDSSPRKIFSTFLVNLTEIIKSLCNPKINFLVTQQIEKWSHIFILAGEVLNNFLQYFAQGWKVGDRSVVPDYVWVKRMFFQDGFDQSNFKRLWENARL